MDLRWQQDTFKVTREYLVLAHGHFGEALPEEMESPVILEDRLEEVTGGCRVSAAGRPSRSLLRPLAHCSLSRGSPSDVFTLLVIRIVTGRRHQIRVQLASRGHPVVGDHRYGEVDTTGVRLFLHRHRLAFHCDGDVSVTEQLPEDLRHFLDSELRDLGDSNSKISIADLVSALPSVYNTFPANMAAIKANSC